MTTGGWKLPLRAGELSRLVVSPRARLLGALVLALFAVAAARVVVGSSAELEAGEQAFGRGEWAVAAVHFRRAGAWYLPFNPFSTRALIRLEELATEAEGSDDLPTALLCWRSVRGAILSARSFYTPHRARLLKANQHIARLMATFDPPPIDVGKGPARVRDEHYALLQVDNRPQLPWVLLAFLGLFAWVGGTFLLSQHGFDPEGRPTWPLVARIALLIVAGMGIFWLGLRFA